MEALTSRLIEILITLPAILISLSVHELAHGFAAYKLGDPTAKFMGRLSLNPLRHIDPLGFLCMMFFRVGWAKPVNVDARFFKKPKRDMAICALAGPMSNFALAFIFSFITVGVYYFGITTGLYFTSVVFDVVFQMIACMVYLNLGLGVFNLIPIPPLDGSKILYRFLPDRILWKVLPYEKYAQFVLFLLLFLDVLSIPIQSIVNSIGELFITIAQGVIL